MKPDLYLKEFKKMTNLMYETTRKKNKDYAGDNNAFKNFECIRYLTENKISVEEGLVVRMTDKLQRITNLLYAKNEVADEKITDTLVDLATYCLILNIYINVNKPKTKSKNSLRSV